MARRTPAKPRRSSASPPVKRWFEDDWTRIEPKLRTSIVEGIAVFLSLFDDNPRVKHTFCPPKDLYDAVANPDGRYGVPLPPLADLIEQGKVVALNFPIAMNPGLARALGTMLKQDFQRAVLNRIQKTGRDGDNLRPVLFVCDEYQAFATTGEDEPSGDEKFFSLARQARCIPIVETQSISSLRSTLHGEAWRTLLEGLRTKIFLALSDDFSAHIAAELCGNYLDQDAAETLSRIMVNQQPDVERFREGLGQLMALAVRSAKADSHRVAIFGECVGLLAGAGYVQAAIQLERAGNGLLKTHDVEILCAYPLTGLGNGNRQMMLKYFCVEHTTAYVT